MFEIIAIILFTSRLVALARSRGRSAAWAIGGPIVWLLGELVGISMSGGDLLSGALLGLPLAIGASMAYYGLVASLPPLHRSPRLGRGDNFGCPCCGSLQTEDRSGHMSCNACGGYFGRS